MELQTWGMLYSDTLSFRSRPRTFFPLDRE